VGLLWTSDQLVVETSSWKHTEITNIHAPGWIEPTISTDEWPQNYALDRATTETGLLPDLLLGIVVPADFHGSFQFSCLATHFADVLWNYNSTPPVCFYGTGSHNFPILLLWYCYTPLVMWRAEPRVSYEVMTRYSYFTLTRRISLETPLAWAIACGITTLFG
jgi:hypothetical protein